MRWLAKETNVAEKTIWRVARSDLELKSYVHVPRHLLTDIMKQKRLERCQKLLGYFCHFSDNKIFKVEQVYNQRNDRYLAGSTEEVKRVFWMKHPALVMVLGVLASDGKKMHV